jgi:hypothetical protein
MGYCILSRSLNGHINNQQMSNRATNPAPTIGSARRAGEIARVSYFQGVLNVTRAGAAVGAAASDLRRNRTIGRRSISWTGLRLWAVQALSKRLTPERLKPFPAR